LTAVWAIGNASFIGVGRMRPVSTAVRA